MINIFCAGTLFGPNDSILNELNKNIGDLSTNNIIIVPDRFALAWEKLIFESLKKESLFNAEVLSINRLSKKILGVKKSVDTKSSTMIIKKLLLDNRKNFKCFKNTLFNSFYFFFWIIVFR